jgi:hypothetical protein
MCFQVYFMPSHRLKGKWSLRRRQGFHSTLSVSFTLRRHSAPLSNFGIIFTHIHLCHWGESKRALKAPFLAINAKGGESISPKQKDRTTAPISKNFEIKFLMFSIGIPLRNSISFGIYILRRSFFSKLVSKIF